MKQKKDFQNTVLVAKARRGERTQRFWIRAAFVFLAGVVLTAVLYLVFRSPLLETRSIDVYGAELVLRSRVAAAVEADTIGRSTLASLLGPQNILFWLFADRTPKLTGFPELSGVEVSVAMWQKKVSISVVERRVESVLCKTAEEQCYGLDRDGIIFTKAPDARGALILRLEDENTGTVVMGNPYLRNPSWFENIKTTLRLLEKDGFVPQRVVVDNEPLEEWRAIFPSGLAFYFSLHFVPENLETILADIANRTNIKNLAYFDFRVPNRIYYK